MVEIENRQWEEAIERVAALCREKENKILVVAIDGKSASGKTTLARLLQERVGGNVYHMDDFFLRKEQRTEERLGEIGGNVDYERFKELLIRIRHGMGVYYRGYDCKRQELKEAVWVEPKRLNIVEGAYSMHPYFEDVYDLCIAMDIDDRQQRQRILKRNGAELLKRFEEEWIPKESAYFEKFHIFEECDLKINNCEKIQNL